MKAVNGTGRIKASRAVKRHSKLSEALLVPCLVKACVRALNGHNNVPGSSLKTLRLVSREVKEAVQTTVQGYTLTLGADPNTHSPGVVSFLRSVHLQSLTVVFPPPSPSGDAGSSTTNTTQHSAQLSCFVTQMGSTLMSGVTHLHLTLPIVVGADTSETAAARALTSMLLPLAFACRNLVQLSITGRVGPSLLQAFGSFCPHIISLRTSLTNLASTTIQQLSTFLPCLTSLAVLPAASDGYYRHDQPNDHINSNAAACIALQACPKLLHFDTTSYHMTAELWAMLPLTLLRCTIACREIEVSGWRNRLSSTPPAPRPWWKPHSNLQSLTSTTEGNINLQELALILTAAPRLSNLFLRRMTIDITLMDRLAEELGVVQERLTAGLTVTYSEDGLPWLEHVPTRLNLYLNPGGSQQMPVFMNSTVPPCPSFHKVTFHGGSPHTAGDLSQLPRVFPNLVDINFINIDLPYSSTDNKMKGDTQLTAMAECTSLKRMEFDEGRYVTRAGLAGLCAASTSLREVKCYGCRDISVTDIRAMSKRGWGGAAVLSIERGVGLDEEDAFWGRGRKQTRMK